MIAQKLRKISYRQSLELVKLENAQRKALVCAGLRSMHLVGSEGRRGAVSWGKQEGDVFMAR